MFRDAALVAGKDLRIEVRSRVATNQVLPFAFLVLVLFAFALDADRGLLSSVAAGLFWVTVLFSGLLAVQRSFAVESGDDARDALRLSGLDGAGIFMGKAGAVVAQLLALEAVLAVGVVVLYDVTLRGADHGVQATQAGLLLLTCLLATAGIAAAGTVYGAVAAGLRMRETLLPLLLLPVLAPVLLAAARASEAALATTTADAWPWVRLLAVFSLVYVAFGLVAFGPLLEES